jgi:hypothetical protein
MWKPTVRNAAGWGALLAGDHLNLVDLYLV